MMWLWLWLCLCVPNRWWSVVGGVVVIVVVAVSPHADGCGTIRLSTFFDPCTSM